MINQVVTDEQINRLREYINRYDNIVITCHLSPDGDAVGASLAMQSFLRALGKNATIVVPDMIPKSLLFLPGSKDIIVYSKYEDLGNRFISNAQLIICLDFNALKRVDNMAPAIGNATATKVVIDHHLFPESFCDLTISYSKMSSTCELVYRVIMGLGQTDLINKQCAECLYTGMMTDTGNFSYNSNNADIYNIIAELVKKGIDKDKLYNVAMNTSSADRLRLIGYALSEKMEIYAASGAALIALDKEELARHNYKRGDTESLVNMPLQVPEVCWSIFMREDLDYIKISARSQGDFAVNEICEQYFNGGGHKNAAGGEFKGTLAEAVAVFRNIEKELEQKK